MINPKHGMSSTSDSSVAIVIVFFYQAPWIFRLHAVFINIIIIRIQYSTAALTIKQQVTQCSRKWTTCYNTVQHK